MSPEDNQARQSGFLRLVRRAIAVEPTEIRALVWAWIYIFSVLMSYYIMRPIRDEMGVAGGVQNLPWLFTGTLVAMIVLNVPFGALVRALPRVTFITVTYRFFAANILLFALALWLANGSETIWIGRIFFIWISVFNLFVVSVFWAMIVDVFNAEQGKRLFGFIAAGATMGAIVGSAVVVGLAQHVPQTALLIGAAILLELAVIGVKRLSACATSIRIEDALVADQVVGGSIIAGMTRTFSSTYIFNTALFLLLFALTSTFLYFEQADVIGHAVRDRAARTEFFATIDLAVNVLTLAIQLFFTSRILRVLGITLTLSLLPALSVIGFSVLAVFPTVMAIVVFQVVRRAGNFAVARPTREILFTVVPREDRYKTKGFIDTVVYRVGDQLGAWSSQLFQSFGVGNTEIAVIAIPLSIIWLLDSLWLGRQQAKLMREADVRSAAAAPVAE
jgi:AAA family ATP:ADP antiporter